MVIIIGITGIGWRNATRRLRTKLIAALVPGLFVLSSLATAEQTFFVKPLVEKKVTELPSGDLFWRIDNFDTKEQAEQAAGPMGLVAEYDGTVWLFKLGQAAEVSKGGKRVAEIGPLPRISATQYLLRVNEAGGPPGSVTPVHTHPGSEAFYVIAGELSQKTPHGVARVTAGQSMVGHGADPPMAVSNSGSSDLRELALFVVDATKPFSSPAEFP
jgi:quercetin dioxygenase-like cupin family protein